MASQWAVQDQNRFPALIGHSGTAGTAETVRVVVDSSGGIRVGGTLAVDEVEITDFNGGTVAIGTAAVELTFTGVTQSIMITADHVNGTNIYLGGSLVSQSGSAAIVSLWPGESCSIDLNDGTAPLYAVAAGTGQKIYKVALT